VEVKGGSGGVIVSLDGRLMGVAMVRLELGFWFAGWDGASEVRSCMGVMEVSPQLRAAGGWWTRLEARGDEPCVCAR
jgi:hypothetical protein